MLYFFQMEIVEVMLQTIISIMKLIHKKLKILTGCTTEFNVHYSIFMLITIKLKIDYLRFTMSTFTMQIEIS